MQLHDLKPKTPRRYSRQVGRGGKRGTTAGRGTKGQKARAGRKIRPELRDLIKKLPKQRGRGKNVNKPLLKPAITISLAQIERYYSAGETLSLATLREKKLIPRGATRLKLVAGGRLSKAISVKGVPVSAGAKVAIEGAGGKFL